MIPTQWPGNLGCTLNPQAPPDAVALIDLSDPQRERIWSYGEFTGRCDAVARGLRKAGLARGDRVGLMCANSADALAVMLGTMRAGCVAVPVNPRAGADTLAFMLQDAQMRLVFVDPAHAPLVPAGAEVLTLDSPAFEDFLDPGPFEPVEPAPDEIGLILYTSGSTGRPKGVLLSHASQVLIARGYCTPAMDACLAAGPNIVAAPLFHMNATVNVTMTLLLGGAFVLMARFDPVLYIQAVHRHRVSVISGVPTMAAMMALETDALHGADLSCVQLVVIGSAPLSQTVLAQVQRLLPGAAVINSYGTTETGAGYFGAHPQGLPRPPMSVGYPQAHGELRLVGEDAPERGVLQVKCDTRMTGYLNRPELTARKLVDGWIDTGDIMSRDAQGWSYFIGRADDMFVCSGENIYPGQVERLLEQHPDVLEVCVVPLDDALRGKVPVAFVVPRPGTHPTAQALKDHVIAHAAPHLYPRRVWFIERMPLAGTNKIDRHELTARAMALAQEAAP
jgi:acyl-CoA synthetase (AMP-forming)/AMP-acid ligase II